MSGDYGRFQPLYGMSVVDLDLPTAVVSVIVAKNSAKIITVQRIVFSPSAYVAATLTFYDTVTGAIIGVLNIPAAPPSGGDGTNMFYLDFGPTGTKLSKGANLGMSVGGGGATGRLHIEAYQKGPLYVVTPYVAPSTAGFTA